MPRKRGGPDGVTTTLPSPSSCRRSRQDESAEFTQNFQRLGDVANRVVRRTLARMVANQHVRTSESGLSARQRLAAAFRARDLVHRAMLRGVITLEEARQALDVLDGSKEADSQLFPWRVAG